MDAKSAFIFSQIAMMTAEMNMMLATNHERISHNYALAYGEEQWADFIKKWEPILGYNEVVKYLFDK